MILGLLGVITKHSFDNFGLVAFAI